MIGIAPFRREWKLAVERTHDMATGIPFLLPVAIDQTPESRVAKVSFFATGSTREVEDFLAHLAPGQANSPEVVNLRADWAQSTGNVAEFLRLKRIQPYDQSTGLEPWEQDILNALDLFMSGAHEQAAGALGHRPEELQRHLAQEPNNPRLWSFKARIELIRGNPEAAKLACERSTGLVPMSMDAVDAPRYQVYAFRCYDYVGDRERALAELARLIRTPGAAALLNVHALKYDPFSKLHGDPRFEAILSDPANNARLF